MKAKPCKKHAKDPVLIYCSCVGCELQRLNEMLEESKKKLLEAEEKISLLKSQKSRNEKLGELILKIPHRTSLWRGKSCWEVTYPVFDDSGVAIDDDYYQGRTPESALNKAGIGVKKVKMDL